MKNLLLSLLIFPMISFAGPPPGGYPKQVPFMLFCHPDESTMLLAAQRSFHEYIFAEGDFMQGEGILFFLRDPDDGSFSIIGTIGEETCIVFNGKNFKEFDQPDVIPSETDEDT